MKNATAFSSSCDGSVIVNTLYFKMFNAKHVSVFLGTLVIFLLYKILRQNDRELHMKETLRLLKSKHTNHDTLQEKIKQLLLKVDQQSNEGSACLKHSDRLNEKIKKVRDALSDSVYKIKMAEAKLDICNVKISNSSESLLNLEREKKQDLEKLTNLQTMLARKSKREKDLGRLLETLRKKEATRRYAIKSHSKQIISKGNAS